MDDALKQMEADLRRRALDAQKRHISIGELRLFITNLRHRGFAVDVKTGQQPHQLTVGIDLGGEDYTAVSPVKHLDLPTSAMLVADLASFKPKEPASSPVKEPVETPAPKPMPQLAPVPKRAAPVAPKDPTPKPAPAKRDAPEPSEKPITGPFSEYEQAEVIRLTAQDVSDRDIALQLNRNFNSVYNWKRNNRDRLRDALAPAEKPEPAPTAPQQSELPYNQRSIAAYLNALGYADGWSAERDLRMVLMLARGEKADRVAAEMKIAPDAVLRRWKAINTAPGDLKQQADLVAVLKLRAGA